MTDNKKDKQMSDKFCWMPGDFTVSDAPKPKKAKPAKNPAIVTDDDYILAHYPLLRDYRLGFLSGIWANQRDSIGHGDNARRAGEIAAAQLAVQYGREIVALEEDVRGRTEKLVDGEAIVELYDWLADNDQFRRAVTDLSGSRTLPTDEQECEKGDVYPSKS